MRSCAMPCPLWGLDNDQGEVLPDRRAGCGGRPHRCPELTDHWQSAGANDRVQLAELGAELNKRLCEVLMRPATIVDPAWVDVDVRVGAGLRSTPAPACGVPHALVITVNGPNATLIDAEMGIALHSAGVVRAASQPMMVKALQHHRAILIAAPRA